jgi:hypothetical protein
MDCTHHKHYRVDFINEGVELNEAIDNVAELTIEGEAEVCSSHICGTIMNRQCRMCQQILIFHLNIWCNRLNRRHLQMDNTVGMFEWLLWMAKHITSVTLMSYPIQILTFSIDLCPQQLQLALA